ncbi:MAG: peptide chain release factor N(5)-glutamine methyltransferase [bacterium]|nr:peptide chain release factor N(5)-glutamine methyltransferase [bacterium]
MNAMNRNAPKTVLEAVQQCADQLEVRKVESPRLSAELLVAHATNLTRAELIADPNRLISPSELAQLQGITARRMKHEPIPYIIEQTEFYSIPFFISRGVFIPRPETETLVDAALEVAKTIPHEPKVYDMYTGSGAIVIAMALNMDEGEFWASDVSNTAIQVAAQNVRRHELQNFVTLKEGPLFMPLRSELSLDFDIVVSNPPYIKTADISKLPNQIKDHEPAIALDGGRDGMICIRSILDGVQPILRPGGYVLIEAEPELIPQIRTEIRRKSTFGDVVIHQDMSGKDRVCQFRLLK